MGIFLVLAGVVLGFIAFMIFGTAQAIPKQLLAGEVAICGAVLFAAGAIIDAVGKLKSSMEAKTATVKPDTVAGS